jgi:LPXTG-motif cell wall-anchored protein
MGMLGATQNFQGWYENGASITTSSSGSITMNAPHTLNAQKTEDDTMPMIILAIIAVAVALIGVVALRRKKKAAPADRPPTVSPQPTATASPAPDAKKGVRFCGNCGTQLSPNSDFCGECGARSDQK